MCIFPCLKFASVDMTTSYDPLVTFMNLKTPKKDRIQWYYEVKSFLAIT